MSLCDMNAPQIVVYVNLWAVAITAIATSLVSVVLYRVTTGLQREAKAFQDGYDQAIRDQAGRIDRHLALGLSYYDAQQVTPRSEES